MKTIFAFLLAVLLLMPLAALGEATDGLTLFVATDLHYLAPELTDHGSCFTQMIERGDGKVMAYSEELVEAFVAQVIARHPDALILSGDLTFDGERASHEALAVKLAQARRDGCRVITVSHQSLLSHSSAPFTSGFSIGNAYALYELYAQAPVLCNLSGHIHMQHMRFTEDGLWDIATSSLAVSPNQYGVLTITENELTYRTETVDVSAWAAAKGLHDPNLLDFASYSEGFFKESARRRALAAATKDDHPEQLADYSAALTAAYFAGRMDAFSPDEQMNERWKQQPSFLSLHIESILKEPPRNHCTLTLSLESGETQSSADSSDDGRAAR